MDNWRRSSLQRLRNCINVVDSGQDTAEKYSWLLRTQKACFGFHSALREAMQNPTCRNGDLQSSCIIFWEVRILGPSENLRCWWSYVHQKGSLHNGLIILTLLSWWPRQWVVTEPACHKCQTLWQFLPHKLTVPIVLAHPNSWHHHHPSRCQHLCRHKVGHC